MQNKFRNSSNIIFNWVIQRLKTRGPKQHLNSPRKRQRHILHTIFILIPNDVTSKRCIFRKLLR